MRLVEVLMVGLFCTCAIQYQQGRFVKTYTAVYAGGIFGLLHRDNTQWLASAWTCRPML